MSKHDLAIAPPLMNAAGSLGYSPDLHSPVDWSKLGAFVTNPVSLLPRTPARGSRYIPYPGGFLLHTGFPNPGLAQVLRRYARQWGGSPIPVIVHLLAQNVDEVMQMARRLELAEGLAGLEVGLPSEANLEVVGAFTQAASGELPVIVRLPLERAVELAPVAMNSGASAISLGAPRGAFVDHSGGWVQGRMYGPSVLPLSLRVVHELTRLGIPTIGAGGVYTQEDRDAMLAAGALAVQLDYNLWREAGYRILL